MNIAITIITTSHYEDKGRDTNVLLFTNDESEAEMVEALAEVYGLDEDEEGNIIGPLNVDFTWDWLEQQIGSYAWWDIDKRMIEV
jgi:hypothetical protein